MYLEVIGLNVEDTKKINESNASRIELCSHLEFGGYTPEYQIIKESCEISKIPVNIMVRHKHSDFFISEDEAEKLFTDIEFIKTTKANAIVIGAITKDFKVDVDFMKKVMARKGTLKVVFHRAFDEIADKVEALRILNDLKVDTVLTSGHKNIEEGYQTLEELAKLNLPINILIGGGVKEHNIKRIAQISKYVHVGSAVRVDGTFNSAIDVQKINNLIKS